MQQTSIERYLSKINKETVDRKASFESLFNEIEPPKKKFDISKLSISYPCNNQFVLGGYTACVCICVLLCYCIYECKYGLNELSKEWDQVMKRGIELWKKWSRSINDRERMSDVKTILDYLHIVGIKELYCNPEEICIETNLDDKCVMTFNQRNDTPFKTLRQILQIDREQEIIVFIIIIRDISILISRKLSNWYLFDSHGHILLDKNGSFYITFNSLDDVIDTVDTLYKHENNEDNITNVSVMRIKYDTPQNKK